MLRSACLVLAGLCWMSILLAALWVFILVFKPRATADDQVPANVLYAISVAAGVLSLGAGLAAWRRQSKLDSTILSGLVGAAGGLFLPGSIILWITSASGQSADDKQKEQHRRTAYYPEVEKPPSIALRGDQLEQAWRDDRLLNKKGFPFAEVGPCIPWPQQR